MGVLSARAQLRDAIRQSYKVSEQLQSAQRKQLVGDYEAARAILLEALAEIPDSASLLDALGSVEQDLGKYLEAERAYLRALSVSGEAAANPERISILHNLGTLYLDTNQYSKGQRIRERLEELRPGVLDDHPTAAAKLLNLVGSLEHARNRNEEAQRYYSRSLLLLRQA
jgi:tetratricopeptide (TPR) repeat protein